MKNISDHYRDARHDVQDGQLCGCRRSDGTPCPRETAGDTDMCRHHHLVTLRKTARRRRKEMQSAIKTIRDALRSFVSALKRVFRKAVSLRKSHRTRRYTNRQRALSRAERGTWGAVR